MSHLTAIAMSGGVDSLVAAHILKKQGNEVIGLHFITGYESEAVTKILDLSSSKRGDGYFQTARRRFERFGKQLGIKTRTLDLSDEFKKKVVNYFLQTYKAGMTPNPCMVCNPFIKFGLLADHARQMGAKRLATGHYARIKKDLRGRPHLLKGVDSKKDQSYFLSRMDRKQLDHAIFPIGNLLKSQVKELADENGLKPIFKQESQDICFIRNCTYKGFIAKQNGFKPEPGPIKDVRGHVIGSHDGLHKFTVGQRRGINCPAEEPYYVVKIDKKSNALIVGIKKNLLSFTCTVEKINWIYPKPEKPFRAMTRIRYRHHAVTSMVQPEDKNSAVVSFDQPQTAITPGQGAVFYHKDEVIGGGWIRF